MNGHFKYLVLAVVALTGLIGASPLDRAAQLPPITSLAVALHGSEINAQGYAEPILRGRVIELVATMHAGIANLSENSLQISGVASTNSGFPAALSAVRDGLPGHVSTDVDVFVIDSEIAVRGICERMFAAVAIVPAQFDETGIRMRSASQPALDRVVDYAEDCIEPDIELVGHSDASGPEELNRALSLQRAQAVADYLVERGVDSERLVLSAAGSAEPISDNETRLGRERNRRVELRLSR